MELFVWSWLTWINGNNHQYGPYVDLSFSHYEPILAIINQYVLINHYSAVLIIKFDH